MEVGSGNSTRIIRQAISDGALNVAHIAIDPDPRDDIKSLVSRMYLDRFEEIDTTEIMAKLGPGDLLFIDSSHEVRVANEVAKLFCVVLPALPSGVTVHVHDIYLPFDYPEPIATRFSDWGEQYLLQAILSARPHVLLWPGYYVHKFLPGLKAQLPFLDSGVPQSLWYRVS